MPNYIIYFHQQWVGEHTEEWFRSRGPLARAVVDEMKDAGVYVFAGGVDEDVTSAVGADSTSGAVVFTNGLLSPDEQYIGGLTIINVPDEQTARMWAGRVAEACGWPQQLRQVT